MLATNVLPTCDLKALFEFGASAYVQLGQKATEVGSLRAPNSVQSPKRIDRCVRRQKVEVYMWVTRPGVVWPG